MFHSMVPISLSAICLFSKLQVIVTSCAFRMLGLSQPHLPPLKCYGTYMNTMVLRFKYKFPYPSIRVWRGLLYPGPDLGGPAGHGPGGPGGHGPHRNYNFFVVFFFKLTDLNRSFLLFFNLFSVVMCRQMLMSVVTAPVLRIPYIQYCS